MNMYQSADHEHIDVAQLTAKMEASPTADESPKDVMQYEDSLALVDTGHVDVEIAHIRSEGVKVNHKDECITADLAGIISTEEEIFGCGNVLAGSTIYCRVLFENPNINGSL